jgi:hypothetical protein
VVEALTKPAGLKLAHAASSLITVCNGNLAAAESFHGKLNGEEIYKLLQKYEGGKLCRSSAPLNPVDKIGPCSSFLRLLRLLWLGT